MARILRERGETVGGVFLLDSHVPVGPDVRHLSAADRATLHLTNLQRERTAYPIRWARERLNWETQQLILRLGLKVSDAAERRSQAIFDAVQSAMDRYEPRVYDGPAVLLRPPLDRRYYISKGRILNLRRELVRPDNGWQRWVTKLTTVEINTEAADHEGMLREPHVHELVSRLEEHLGEIQEVEAKPDHRLRFAGAGVRGE
jgi:thioesterase domain-containing protein